jgi:hypothetical protein
MGGVIHSNGMQINTDKTKVVVFGSKEVVRPFQHQQWVVADRLLQKCDVLKYLGVVFHATKGILYCVQPLLQQAKVRMWALYEQAREVGARRDKPFFFRLFDTMGLPTLLYGSQV